MAQANIWEAPFNEGREARSEPNDSHFEQQLFPFDRPSVCTLRSRCPNEPFFRCPVMNCTMDAIHLLQVHRHGFYASNRSLSSRSNSGGSSADGQMFTVFSLMTRSYRRWTSPMTLKEHRFPFMKSDESPARAKMSLSSVHCSFSCSDERIGQSNSSHARDKEFACQLDTLLFGNLNRFVF